MEKKNRYDRFPEMELQRGLGLNPPVHRLDVDEKYPGEAKGLFTQACNNLLKIICIKRGTEFADKLTNLTIELNNLAYEYKKMDLLDIDESANSSVEQSDSNNVP